MTNQDQLSTELRRLRKAAGLTGTEAARLTGLSQSKVSRVETGAFMPTEDQVVALCRVYGAPAKVRRALVAITRDLREEASSARVVLQRGAWRMQQRIGKIETASARIRSFQPTIVFGLLQTRDYITALFGDSLPADERDQTVEARLERQRILDSNREFHFVLTEGALRWNMGGAATMLAQLDHLVEVSRRGRVRLGVIPWTTPVSVRSSTVSTSTTRVRCSSAPRRPRRSSRTNARWPTTRRTSPKSSTTPPTAISPARI